MANFKFDVFLSHSSKDKPIVRQVAEFLKSKGISVWFDDWSVKIGEDINIKVEEGLTQSKRLLLFMSNNAFSSEWVTLERSTILFKDPNNRDRRFIPILIDSCTIPDTLQRFKHLNFVSLNDEFKEQLIDTLNDNEQAETILWANNKNEEQSKESDEADLIAKKAKQFSRKEQYQEANKILKAFIDNINPTDIKTYVRFKLEYAMNIVRDDVFNLDEPLEIANDCLEKAKNNYIGDELSRTLQILGELHRLNRDRDKANGFINASLENSKLKEDFNTEAWANLSLCNLKKEEKCSEQELLKIIDVSYGLFIKEQLSNTKNSKQNSLDGFANCHLMRAEIYRRNRKDEAITEYSKAIEIYDTLGEDWKVTKANILHHRGEVFSFLDEYEQSISDIYNAIEIFQSVDNYYKVAKCILTLAEILDGKGHRTKAEEFYRWALATVEKSENESKQNWFYFRYAMKLTELQKVNEAKDIYVMLLNRETTTLSQKLDILKAVSDISKATQNEKFEEEAQTLSVRVIDDLLLHTKNSKDRLRLLFHKVHSLQGLKKYDEALEILERCDVLAKSLGKTDYVFDYLNTKATIFHDLGNLKEEKDTYYKLIEITKDKEDSVQLLQTYIMLSQTELKQGNKVEAQELIDKARKICKKYPFLTFVVEDIQGRINEA
jgi:tetratricopeptide (TPR) repeat protein